MMGFKSLTTNQPFWVISVIYCSMIYQLSFILTAAVPDKLDGIARHVPLSGHGDVALSK